MESEILFANEKDLIYGYKWDGSYMPEYGFCKVYKNGVVDFGEGWMINVDEFTSGRTSISKSAVSEIQELIRNNSEIFSMKDLENVKELLISLDALHLANKRICEMSSGEQMKMLIARALSFEPELMILDEPNVFLDIKEREFFLKILENLINDHPEITIIFISQRVVDILPEFK